jgi:uncharacterized FlaG/YvyC family protein
MTKKKTTHKAHSAHTKKVEESVEKNQEAIKEETKKSAQDDKHEHLKEEITDVAEKVLEKAEEFVKEGIEWKLEDFAKSKIVETVESRSWIQSLVKSPCIEEFFKKIWEKKVLMFKLIGFVSVIFAIIALSWVFSDRVCVSKKFYYVIWGFSMLLQGWALLGMKKRAALVVWWNGLVWAGSTILALIISQVFLLGSLGNILWILLLLLLLFILILKSEDLFDK